MNTQDTWTSQGLLRAMFPVEGLTCVADATRLEHALRNIDGVVNAMVNPATECAYVTFDRSVLSEDELRQKIVRWGFRVG